MKIICSLIVIYYFLTKFTRCELVRFKIQSRAAVSCSANMAWVAGVGFGLYVDYNTHTIIPPPTPHHPTSPPPPPTPMHMPCTMHGPAGPAKMPCTDTMHGPACPSPYTKSDPSNPSHIRTT